MRETSTLIRSVNFIIFFCFYILGYLEDTLDKINGGDAHFTQIKLAELPDFVHLKD